MTHRLRITVLDGSCFVLFTDLIHSIQNGAFESKCWATCPDCMKKSTHCVLVRIKATNICPKNDCVWVLGRDTVFRKVEEMLELLLQQYLKAKGIQCMPCQRSSCRHCWSFIYVPWTMDFGEADHSKNKGRKIWHGGRDEEETKLLQAQADEKGTQKRSRAVLRCCGPSFERRQER